MILKDGLPSARQKTACVDRRVRLEAAGSVVGDITRKLFLGEFGDFSGEAAGCRMLRRDYVVLQTKCSPGG